MAATSRPSASMYIFRSFPGNFIRHPPYASPFRCIVFPRGGAIPRHFITKPRLAQSHDFRYNNRDRRMFLCQWNTRSRVKSAGGRARGQNIAAERDELNILVRNQGRNQLLLLSASAGCARAHITREKKVSPLEPPMLCMLFAQAHFRRPRAPTCVRSMATAYWRSNSNTSTSWATSARKILICEFMGRHSNLILVDGEGGHPRMCAAGDGEHVLVREVLPGLRYERPPEHGKTPFDAPEADIVRALQGASGPLHKAIAGAISGLFPCRSARELAYPAPPATRTRTRRNWIMSSIAPSRRPRSFSRSAGRGRPGAALCRNRRAGGRGGLFRDLSRAALLQRAL